MTQALAISNGKLDKADNISKWFNNFDDLLKQIFDDESVRVDFDEDTFKFSIVMDGRKSLTLIRFQVDMQLSLILLLI